MIAISKPQSPQLSSEHQQQFLAMLPVITAMARRAFGHRDPEAREEATAEVVAAAFVMFVGLVRRGRAELAYPSPLAGYGIKRVRIGRPAATPMNVRDVSSTYCQLKKGVTVERLDRFDRQAGGWMEVVVEDHRTPPPEQAAFRCDFPVWLATHSRRNRRIAEALAVGGTTSEIARQFGISAGRVSQLRRELHDSWQCFHGEQPSDKVAARAAA